MMPSVFKYFWNVGAVLFILLIAITGVMDKGGPGPHLVDAPKKVASIRHDPQASLVERLRAEEAAQNVIAPMSESAVSKVMEAEQANDGSVAAPVILSEVKTKDQPSERTMPARPTISSTEEATVRAAHLRQDNIKHQRRRTQRLARKWAQGASSLRQDEIYFEHVARPRNAASRNTR